MKLKDAKRAVSVTDDVPAGQQRKTAYKRALTGVVAKMLGKTYYTIRWLENDAVVEAYMVEGSFKAGNLKRLKLKGSNSKEMEEAAIVFIHHAYDTEYEANTVILTHFLSEKREAIEAHRNRINTLDPVIIKYMKKIGEQNDGSVKPDS